METVNDGLDSLNQLDNSGKHGRNPDIQQRDNLGDRGVVDVDNTYAITNNMDKDDESFKSQSDSFKENNVTDINVTEQFGLKLIGPTQTKLKSTWTRIMRMDYGLGSIIRATDTPVLGKRRSPTDLHATIPDEVEKIQRRKRKKLDQNNDDGLARVVDHPCREQ